MNDSLLNFTGLFYYKCFIAEVKSSSYKKTVITWSNRNTVNENKFENITGKKYMTVKL